MTQPKENLRVALICNNVVRELSTLTRLKVQLEQTLPAKVKIIGSLAEIQRTYYSLYKFKPHIVFLSQLQEKCCRDIAQYVRKAGGVVVVMPEEITPAKVVESLILSPSQNYDHLVDLVCLPGEVMNNFFQKTDIQTSKIKITGSPKIDVEIKEKGLSRPKFHKRFALDRQKKKVFIFTSFPTTGIEYFKSDACFSDQLTLIKDIQKAIKETRESYLRDLPVLCKSLSEYSIILKPHPLEDLQPYQSIQAPNLKIVTGISVLDCMDSIDVAIHWNSTVSTSCWLHQIPTFQYSPLKAHDWLLSGFTPGNPLIQDAQKLTRIVDDYIKRPRHLPQKYLTAQDQYFRENFYKLDGKSTQRITQLVKALAQSRVFSLDYKPEFHTLWHIIPVIEKIVGVTWSRRTMNALSGTYNWRYASDNYLP